MINGDRLLAVSAAGGPRVLGILPGAAGSAGPLVGLDLGGTALEIPAVALPYLGRGLAPGLFEPSALAAGGDRRPAAGDSDLPGQGPGTARRDDHRAPAAERPRVT